MSNRFTRGVGLFGRMQTPGNVQWLSGVGGPLSGTSGQKANPSSIYVNSATGVAFVNEGTLLAPYWSPVSFDHPALLGVRDDFRGPAPKPIGDATASLNTPSGIRVFGQGIAELDSGLVLATDVAGSRVARLTTTNEAAHVAAIGMGSSVAMMSPTVNGPLVVDVLWTQVANILTRRLFVGFAGEAADAMDPLITGATTVITFSAGGSTGDDMAGICMDANLTDVDGLFLAHVKADAGASIATTAPGVDLSTALAAAATYQRMRVEVSAAGVVTAFINKVQVSRIVGALTPATVVKPVASLMVESGTTALSADIKQFMAWGNRS